MLYFLHMNDHDRMTIEWLTTTYDSWPNEGDLIAHDHAWATTDQMKGTIHMEHDIGPIDSAGWGMTLEPTPPRKTMA